MTQLGRNAQVIKLARDLGLPIRGDCLEYIKAFALSKTRHLTDGFELKSIRQLQRVLANRLLVRIAVIETDDDVDRIAQEHSHYSSTLQHCLHLEFLSMDTEGITIEHESPHPGELRYLAVIDARRQRRRRAYFTLWHELTHVLIMPEQLVFKAFRRAPSEQQREKDPLEKTVDSITGLLAFYEPLFGPTLNEAVAREGNFNFAAIEAARSTMTPEASLFATAVASVSMCSRPATFIAVDYAYKKSERAQLEVPRLDLGDANPKLNPKLRALHVVTNRAGSSAGLAIRRNMRVPATSALRKAHDSLGDTTVNALEDQGQWESTSAGQLARLPMRVEAIRRGTFVYGLIEPLSDSNAQRA
jgi:hypothetical protein